MPGVALVTGASRGIGKAIALRLSEDGFDVALNDIPPQKAELDELRNEILKAGKKAFIWVGDVSVEGEVKRMIDEVVQELGSLDVMVANAGICITKPFLETTKEDFDRMFAVNVDGVFFCYKYAALQMTKQGKGGRIIGASSITGKQGYSNLAAYGATKFAVRGLTQSVASELAKYGITVNAYAPGAVDTAMLTDLRASIRQLSAGDQSKDPTITESANVKLPTDSSPHHIAALVSYLASKDAEMITGQSISINGGKFFD
ncbi:acetoin reductase family protein [Pholiota molesta]|nr:acetoin reductase family protein [Pholiota molesta]